MRLVLIRNKCEIVLLKETLQKTQKKIKNRTLKKNYFNLIIILF